MGTDRGFGEGSGGEDECVGGSGDSGGFVEGFTSHSRFAGSFVRSIDLVPISPGVLAVGA